MALAACCSAHLLQNRQDDVHLLNFIRGTCPAYFRDGCRPVAPGDARARLRSVDHGDLVEHRTNTKARYTLPVFTARVRARYPCYLMYRCNEKNVRYDVILLILVARKQTR